MEDKKKLLIQLYKANVTIVYRYFYKRTFSKEISEDLTSSVFLEFAEKFSKDENEIENYNKYIFGIAKNKLLDYLRNKYKNQEIVFDQDESESIFFASTLSDNNYFNKLIEKLKKLLPLVPAKQRMILELRFLEKFSIKEIAQKLGKDENYVKTTQKRGIKTLKELAECTPKST